MAKFKKNSQGTWEQSWFSSDTDSYVLNRIDITSNSQILVAGRTGSGGYSAAYDKNGNQTERLMDDSSEAKASIDHSTSSNGTGFIRKVDGQWLVGSGDGYVDNDMIASDHGSYSMDPVAVVKIDDYYRLAVKHTSTYQFDGTNDINTNWEIYKIKSDGEIDWSGHVWTESITSWEDEFDLDLNGDGDKSGQVSLTNRNTDTTGAILASEGANGALHQI